MKQTNRRIQLKIDPLLIVYFFVLSFTEGVAAVISLLMTLAIHEAAHIIASYLLNESFEKIELTPFGGRIVYRSICSGSKGWKGIVLAACGPAANYLLIIVLSAFPVQSFYEVQKQLINANVSMLFLNLLPVLPLDGGRIVFSIGYYWFPLSTLLNVLTAVGWISGAVFVVLSIIGCATLGKLNISLLMIGIYILATVQKERFLLLLNNRYTVIQETIGAEKNNCPTKTRYVNEKEPLIGLLPFLSSRKFTVFLSSGHNKLVFFGEDELCRMLLNQPAATVRDIIDKK